MKTKAVHGGSSFDRIGTDFATLKRSRRVVSADVLDAWFNPSPKVVRQVRRYLKFALRSSPPMEGEGLIRTIASVRRVPAENIVLGAGSSALMYTFFPLMLSAKDTVLVLDPTYSEYAFIAEKVVGAKLMRHTLRAERGFGVSIGGLAGQIKSERPSMVILVNPNSPTGEIMTREQILGLCKAFPRTHFVVDEAYIDYVGTGYSVERDVPAFKNLSVLKTMSKGYALSGARVAYLVASKECVEKVALGTPPWSVGLVAQIAAVAALRDPAYYRSCYRTTKLERMQMTEVLSEIGFKVYGKVANFVTVDVRSLGLSARHVVEGLKKKDIYIRSCDGTGTVFNDDFVRIAIKDPATNRRIIKVIRELV